MPVTMSGTAITFDDASRLVTAPRVYSTAVYIAATSSWTVPSGVTEILLLVMGGGGLGGDSQNVQVGDVSTLVFGANGGTGGIAVKRLAVTPSTSLSITVGAGNGGTSSVVYSGTTYSASGGASGVFTAAGADGVGTNGDVNSNVRVTLDPVLPMFATYSPPIIGEALTQTRKLELRPQGSGTGALAWATSGSFVPGAAGQGAQNLQRAGGVGGAIFIYH